MQKKYISLGLMSGTSGDGVDASVIISDGISSYESLKNKYFEYDDEIYKKIHFLKEKINNLVDLKKIAKDLSDLEKKITFFHAKIIKDFKIKYEDFLVGFHGQTIYHNASEKVSKQLGDGRLLHQLIKKKIICNFRKNDLENGGEGAPLTPLFHRLIVSQRKIKLPVCLLNIGGISNITIIEKLTEEGGLFSQDIGPGNCLIDSWVRKNSEKKFDTNGKLSESGEINEIILEQAQELYANRNKKDKLSFDVNDFDISFARGLSLEDGATTLTKFTANIISSMISDKLSKLSNKQKKIILCGGGRKNKILVEKIRKNLNSTYIVELIDEYGVDGDFVESQAFAFLAIRSYLKLPITFPSTTGCKKPCTGGELFEN